MKTGRRNTGDVGAKAWATTGASSAAAPVSIVCTPFALP
jgi:hypothetical protein